MNIHLDGGILKKCKVTNSKMTKDVKGIVKHLLGEENKGVFFRIENLELNFPAYDFLLCKLSECSNCKAAYVSIQGSQYSS